MSTAPGGRGFSTRAVHVAAAAPRQQPASVPIYQTATWRFADAEEYAEVLAGRRPGQVYGRGYGNPTVEAFEAAVAALEGTEAAFAFSSGMAAIHTTVLALVPPGGRLVAGKELYGGTYGLFRRLEERERLRVEFVDPGDAAALAAALEGAAACYVETITNPRCEVTDLEAVAAACRDAGVPAIVDHTFATPYLCTPAAYGFDYVLHSATKYLAGHSDVVAGVVATSAAGRQRLRELALETGGACPPFDAWLCLRGLVTLGLRVARQCETAAALAAALAAHPRVEAVHYPGLREHPGHRVAERLFRPGCYGGMLALEVSGGAESARRFTEALELGWLGASLGGPHTLVTHPASTTHRQVEPARRRELGIADGLVRVSAGLEDVADLLEDFCRALDAA